MWNQLLCFDRICKAAVKGGHITMGLVVWTHHGGCSWAFKRCLDGAEDHQRIEHESLKMWAANNPFQIPEGDRFEVATGQEKKGRAQWFPPRLEGMSQNHITSLQTCKDERSLSYTACTSRRRQSPSLSQKRRFHGSATCACNRREKTWLLLIPNQLGSFVSWYLFVDFLVVCCWFGSVNILDLRDLLGVKYVKYIRQVNFSNKYHSLSPVTRRLPGSIPGRQICVTGI